MQRKCHCCNRLFNVTDNEIRCEDCRSPTTQKTFKPYPDQRTWKEKFDEKWEQYDKEHDKDNLTGKRSSKATHCCVCGIRLPPVHERVYGRFCSSKCKRSFQNGKEC